MQLVTVVRVLVIAGLMAACGAAVPPLPSKGGPAWIELSSPHFVLWTDADPERGRELIREMERMRQILVGTVFRSVDDRGTVLAVALRDEQELATFTRGGDGRPFAVAAGRVLWQPLFVLSAFSNLDPEDRMVAHELTHAITYSVVHHQPRWLAEGMATYFETIDLDPDRTTADIGEPLRRRGQVIKMPHLIPVSRLFAWGDLHSNEGSEYSTAWALFTFLFNEHRAELVRYLELLEQTAASSTTRVERDARSWQEAFPALSPSALDLELRHWLVAGSHQVQHVTLRIPVWPISERRLGDADVLAMRGVLRAIAQTQDQQAHADVSAALAEDPNNVLGWLAKVGYWKSPLDIARARALAAAHPRDWRAWYLAARALELGKADAAEREAARELACSLAAQNPAVTTPPGLCNAAAAPAAR